jgi:hypothetical protein
MTGYHVDRGGWLLESQRDRGDGDRLQRPAITRRLTGKNLPCRAVSFGRDAETAGFREG